MAILPTPKNVRRAQQNSRYLRESFEKFPDLLERTLVDAPEKILTSLYEASPKTALSHDAEMQYLRGLKRQAHMVIALADISQIWSWVEVTRALTALADFAMKRLLIAGAQELDIYSGDPDNPCLGVFILGVGKYGAHELNYSSDIDFSVFYDPERLSLARPQRAERTLIRFVQLLIRGFERVTADGYVFRTDLRLRPDPRSNAVAVSTVTAERYYEQLGQNWERAAMIKARVSGGDRAAGEAFISTVLTPFVWRRSLDYAAIEDIHSIKRQIQARHIAGVDGDGRINPAGHHLKLGTGGIREIEFYAQTQQLILGGRDPSLRSSRTVDALAALAQAGYVKKNEAQLLTEFYGDLRRFEHAAQMREDMQTHDVPRDNGARLELARLSGFDTVEAFDRRACDILTGVHRLYSELFPGYESLTLEDGNLAFTGVEPDPETLKTLARLGFSKPEYVWRKMADWLGGRVKATRSQRARELLTRLAPGLLKICSETGSADAAFQAFGSFFDRLNSGISLLAMFVQDPRPLRRVIGLMLVSPPLSETLSSRPAILDSLIDPAFLEIDVETLKAGYDQRFLQGLDFEESMNMVRRQLREDQFRLTASLLSGSLDFNLAGSAFTGLAEASVNALLPVAVKETERRTGKLDGEYAVLALGKLGGGELSLISDLDIMLIYEAPLSAAGDFTKLTQRLVSALSATTAEGGLYDVDMALRPSGRSGPVAVNLEAFEHYYAKDAWTWEFMALTRARVIAGSSEMFMQKITCSVNQQLCLPRRDLAVDHDIFEMHARLAIEKPARGPWDMKQSPGTLRDIEFIAQALYLDNRPAFSARHITATQAMLEYAVASGALEDGDFKDISKAMRFYHYMIQTLALTHGGVTGEPDSKLLTAAAQRLGYHDGAELALTKERHICAVLRLLPKFIKA